MTQLKLIAFDQADLRIISAQLQDAVLKAADMAWRPHEKRFVAILNRFDWSRALGRDKQLQRRQCAFRLERVLKAQLSGIDPKSAAVLSLLAIQFEPTAPDNPAGVVTLFFAGDSAIRLQVECIEAELRDLGPVWGASAQPSHPEDEAGAT
jgi:hypothetical protein